MDPNGTFIHAYGRPIAPQFSSGGRPPGYYVSVGMYPQQVPIAYATVEDNRASYSEAKELPLIQRKRQLSEAETVFRLLLPESQLASLMNGSSDFRMPVGCQIRICEKILHCEERVVVISAKDERKDDSNIAMQGLLHAVKTVLLMEQALREDARNSNQFYMVRLLINRTQAGAVIGKGGSLNKEIRERTGAYSKILNCDEVPVCALHNDRVVQVTGSVEQVMAGMQIIAKQLRDNVSKERPGGPPSCLAVLSGYTLYYAHEAPPYLPATDYGRPSTVPNVTSSPSTSGYTATVHPPPPPPNQIFASPPRQPGYIQQNRPGRAVYSQSPVIYATDQTHPPGPYNGSVPPVYYQ